MLDTLEMFGMILMILLMFTVMVVVHEWGHYITAKKFGVLVHEFAIGMGPVLWSFIPLGYYQLVVFAVWKKKQEKAPIQERWPPKSHGKN